MKMNKKLVLLFVLCIRTTYSQLSESSNHEAEIDLAKINGSQSVTEKVLFSNIETIMSRMEDNILKLMRELGELKMQVQEAKVKVQKELDVRHSVIERQKQESADSEIKSTQSVADAVTTNYSSKIYNSVTSLSEKSTQNSSLDNNISDSISRQIITTDLNTPVQ